VDLDEVYSKDEVFSKWNITDPAGYYGSQKFPERLLISKGR
jgi:hypothetical protein